MDLYRGSKRALYRAKETKPTLLNNNVVLWHAFVSNDDTQSSGEKAMQWLDSSKLLEHMRDRLAAIFTDKRLEMLSNIYVASLRCLVFTHAPEYALLRAYVHTIYVLDTKCILRSACSMRMTYVICLLLPLHVSAYYFICTTI